MDGKELLERLAEAIKERRGVDKLSESELARELGTTSANLAAYRKNGLTPLKVARLVERVRTHAVTELRHKAIVPIVEFLSVDLTASKRDANWELFSPSLGESTNRYLQGIKDRLQNATGIYIFYDSRGRAVYVGRAIDQSLWKEMTNAFNRDRRKVQSIKRVAHPARSVVYKSPQELNRPIRKEDVKIYDLAAYFSAYEIEHSLIAPVEALLIRGFANDLLNTRMEKL